MPRARRKGSSEDYNDSSTVVLAGPIDLDSHLVEPIEDLFTDKTRAQVNKLVEETRSKKLANDEKEGLLLPADDVRQWVAAHFLRIKQRLELLPDQLQVLAPQSFRAQFHADMTNEIRSLLLEISGWQQHVEKGTLEGE